MADFTLTIQGCDHLQVPESPSVNLVLTVQDADHLQVPDTPTFTHFVLAVQGCDLLHRVNEESGSTTAYPTVTGDDGYWRPGNTNPGYTPQNAWPYGDKNGTECGLCRFKDIAIPQGADVESAVVKLTCYQAESHSGHTFNCYFNDVDDVSSMPTTHAEADGLSLTSAVSWVINSQAKHTQYDSEDLSTPLEEVLGRTGWSSGNAVLFIIKPSTWPGDSYYACDYEYESGQYKPELDISYKATPPISLNLHLAPQSADHIQATENAAVNQLLATNDVDHTHSVAVALVNQQFVPDDAFHSQVAETFWVHLHLVPADTYHSHAIDNAAVNQQLTNMADCTHIHNADGTISLVQHRTYPLDEIQYDLVRDVKDIIQDTTYGYADILGLLNEAQDVIAGGVLLTFPDGAQVFSAPLEDLETSDTVTAGTSNPYVSLPSDYQRDLFYVYNDTTSNRVILLDSFGNLLKQHPNLDQSSNVSTVAINGKSLYFQGIPDSSQNLVVKYFREPHEMATYTSTGVSFSGTTISDSNNGLGVFYAEQTIDLTGSYLNRGGYEISAVASDGSTITVETSLTTESAGSSITIRSRPDGIPEHLRFDVLGNYVIAKYFQRDVVHNIKGADFAKVYMAKFYSAMIHMDVSRFRRHQPIRLRA